MDFLLSINAKEFIEFGVTELVRFIKKNDRDRIINGAEIAVDDQEDEQKKFVIDLASAMSEAGWAVQLHAADIYGSGRRSIPDMLLYYNSIAEICCAKTKVTFHPADMPSIKDSINETVTTFEYINNLIEKKRLGLDILLENLNTYGGKPRCNIEQIFEILGGSLKNKITLDLGHYVFDYRIRDIRFDTEHFKKAGNVHIHDIDEEGRDHQPFYHGNVCLKKMKDILNQIGYNGSVVAEIALCFLKGDSFEARLQEYICQIRHIAEKLDCQCLQ